MLQGIDHIVIVVNDLEQAAKDYEQLGFTVVAGGKHPVGSHNALISLADGSYIEIIAFYREAIQRPLSSADDLQTLEATSSILHDLLGNDDAPSWKREHAYFEKTVAALSYGVERLPPGTDIDFSSTVMSIVTLGCSATNSSAMSCQRDLPGSLFWMCHHSMVTGSAAASDGAVEAGGASVGAAALGAVDAPPLLQAANTIALRAIAVANRRVDTMDRASSLTLVSARGS